MSKQIPDHLRDQILHSEGRVSYDVQGYRETGTPEWVNLFGERRCTLRRAKKDLAEAREERPNIRWRLALRYEPELIGIPDDYEEENNHE